MVMTDIFPGGGGDLDVKHFLVNMKKAIRLKTRFSLKKKKMYTKM